MSTRPAPRTSAAPRAVIRSGAGRRSTLTPADRLEQLSNRLDWLIRDVRAGASSHREVERLVGEGEAIADGIRAVFRESAPAVNPPLFHQGYRAAW